MAHGDFIWCDLSAYKPGRATAFYSAVMGWRWSDVNGQRVALNGTVPVAAVYQMPAKFMSMGMPSFWMTYIAVDDVAATVEQAQSLGGKVELGPEEFPGGGRYALIRDPLGAGFTVLEGEAGTEASSAPGARAGHALFVSDASAIIPFYEALFGWSFGAASEGVCGVYRDRELLFHCHEVPDPAIRGKEEFWAVLFSAHGSASAITKHGGGLMTDLDLPEGPAVLAHDPDGAAFIVMKQTERAANISPPAPWRAWVGLGLVAVLSLTGHQWPWVIFLGIALVHGMRDEETWLLQPVRRADHGVLYWLVMGCFALMALYSLINPFGVSG